MDIQIQFKQLTDGLYYMSESDFPFEVLTLDPEMTLAALTPEDVLLYLEPEVAAWQNRTPTEFLARMARVSDWMTDDEKATADRFAELLDFINQESEVVGVFKVGLLKK